MTCDECTSRLSDALDGELDSAAAAAVDAHLRSCAACRGVADDLQQVTAAARTLEQHAVPPAAWSAIAARLGEPLRASSWRTGWLPARLTAWPDTEWRRVAVALGVLLVLAGGAAGWAVRSVFSTAPGTSQVGASTDEAVQTVEAELALAQEHYERAIASLEQITSAVSTVLDPEIAAVLQRNLTVIDGAIDESREALNAQPTSEVVQQNLFGALRSKVTLLQETVALINEMRQGDQEGAARILSGLSQ